METTILCLLLVVVVLFALWYSDHKCPKCKRLSLKYSEGQTWMSFLCRHCGFGQTRYRECHCYKGDDSGPIILGGNWQQWETWEEGDQSKQK